MSTIHGPGAIAPASRLAPPVPEFPDETIGGEAFGRQGAGDELYADPSALLAQAPAHKPAGAGKPPLDPVGFIGHLGAPDAIVYTLGAANLAGQRHFALANPLTGTATHFISHKNDKVSIGGLAFNRVEAVHYGLGQSPRREDGLGWSRKVGDLTLFANVRGGDAAQRPRCQRQRGSVRAPGGPLRSGRGHEPLRQCPGACDGRGLREGLAGRWGGG